MERESKYSEAVGEAVCERLAEGESLREICAEAEMPSRATVRRWLREEKGFAALYARARVEQADHFADEILDIAHDGRNDWIQRENKRSGVTSLVADSESVMRSRLRIDTLKWLMAKLAPKKYGDKADAGQAGDLDIEVTIGGDGQ